jgi:hypothetical protein
MIVKLWLGFSILVEMTTSQGASSGSSKSYLE